MFGKINSFVKDMVLASRVAYLWYPFRKFLLFLANLSELTAWIHRNKKTLKQNDFYTLTRDYSRRINGFDFLLNNYQLENLPITYFEFGVASGVSFEWWLNHAKNPGSVFFGFDTFEGLPEDWGLFFKKGAMSHNIKEIADERHTFFKGIFQDTLNKAIDDNKELLKQPRRKVILLDADLFSSTIFVLSQLYPYLQKGDIIIFDEYNVPNHEFFALKIFRESFYVKMKPVSALNNFYQTAFEIE